MMTSIWRNPRPFLILMAAFLAGCVPEENSSSITQTQGQAYTCASDSIATTCFAVIPGENQFDEGCWRDPEGDRDGFHYIDCGAAVDGPAYLIIPDCGVAVAAVGGSCMMGDCGYDPDVDLEYCPTLSDTQKTALKSRLAALNEQ